MAQDSDSSGSDPGAPKKKGLNLDLLFGPVKHVPTSIGTLHLYGLRVSDMSAFVSSSGSDAISRVRSFLPHIASLTEAKGFKDERPPLTTEEVDRLSVVEVETVAEAYAELLLRGSRIKDDEDTAKPERESGEPATSYLDRLLKHEAEEQSQQLRKIHEKMLASNSGIFDQVRKSSSALGSTLSAFDQLTKSAAPVEIRAPSMDHFHAMNEQFARQARERAEELEMVRLTGKMTAESAKTLKDLAEAATVLLEQLDERDKKADESTRKQIAIAVWSVGVSAVIAVVALLVSAAAYMQDQRNGASGDKFQADLLEAIKDGNRQTAALTLENQRLRTSLSDSLSKLARTEPRSTTEPSASAPSVAKPPAAARGSSATP